MTVIMKGKERDIKLAEAIRETFIATYKEQSNFNTFLNNLGSNTVDRLLHRLNSTAKINLYRDYNALKVIAEEVINTCYRQVYDETCKVDDTRVWINNKGKYQEIVFESLYKVFRTNEKLANFIEETEEVKAEKNSNIEYHIGTMIEIPRAAITADEIAKEAEFFSFGTNDLTQMTFGFSRDDAGKFLNSYYDTKIYEADPFAKLDQTGVGQLVEMAATKGKATRPDIKLGICGEHGGDPSSVEFCHKVGLTYVSCSPFRVPIARLAAAQAAIK